jgi:hypothetical protein
MELPIAMNHRIRVTLLETMRWTARSLGFIPSFFFVLFLTGEGVPDLLEGKTNVIPIMIMVLFSVAGYILSWWKLRVGAVIMIFGGFIMGIYLLILGGEGIGRIAGSFSLPFIIPGCLFFLMKNVAPSKPSATGPDVQQESETD